jgi:putative transcriptional regulator
MIEILQNKNSATRFEILVQIAASGPNVQQRHIAGKLGITPQAVSDYMHRLIEEDLVVSPGRSSYRVSVKGVNWMLEMLRDLRDYSSAVAKTITNITTCAAIAETEIRKGQRVGLKMKDGVLVASGNPGKGAKGISMSTVKQGEDVDVSNIEGLIDLAKGKITVLQVPSIRKGGSRLADLKKLKSCLGTQAVGTIGIEALAVIRKTGMEPQYTYGVTEAAIEAAHCGLAFIIACTDDAVPGLVKRLRDEGLEYELIDLSKNKRNK